MEQAEWGQPGYDISFGQGPQRRSPQHQQRQRPGRQLGQGRRVAAAAEGRPAAAAGGGGGGGGGRDNCSGVSSDDDSWSEGAGRGSGALVHLRPDGMNPTSLCHCWA